MLQRLYTDSELGALLWSNHVYTLSGAQVLVGMCVPLQYGPTVLTVDSELSASVRPLYSSSCLEP